MHPTNARSARGPAQARTGYRRRRGILALLAALACLAGFAMAELKASPSGPTTSLPGTVTPGAGTVTPGAGTITPGAGTGAPLQERLAAVPWPADGASAAD